MFGLFTSKHDLQPPRHFTDRSDDPNNQSRFFESHEGDEQAASFLGSTVSDPSDCYLSPLFHTLRSAAASGLELIASTQL